MHQLGERDLLELESELKIGYIGGGSRGWAHTFINDILQCNDISGRVALYDLNYEPAAQNAKFANQLASQADGSTSWSFEACDKLDEALEGADFVICSTQDPPEETFAYDIDIPQEYGIYQTVADTVGPGGAIRALRSIPQYREIAATVREQCPEAWVINYTNPMTVCTRTLYEEFPEINAIGLCHEVFHTQDLLANIAEKYIPEAEDVDADEIDVNVKGVNHFTWIDEAYWYGEDIFQHLDEELDERKPFPGFEPGELEGKFHGINHHQIAFDLFDRFGLLGAAGDRHLVEFVPWYLDIDDPSEIERWGIRLTPSSHRVSRDEEKGDEMRRYLDGDEEFEFEESGEEAIDIIRALLGIEPVKTNVNYPNIGQMPDITEGAVVETNAIITGAGVKPITAGKFPEQVRDMVQRTVTNQESLIQAGFAGDLDLAFQAFLNEPLVNIQRDKAEELFTDLISIESEYLQDYDLEASEIVKID